MVTQPQIFASKPNERPHHVSYLRYLPPGARPALPGEIDPPRAFRTGTPFSWNSVTLRKEGTGQGDDTMKIFLTGATGFLGRALSLRLQRDGHEVVAWTRSEKRGRARLGGDVTLVSTTCSDQALSQHLQTCDAVINLAGESVAGARWTASRKRELTQSRVGLTERLVEAIERANPRPRVLLSASAVGYYGDSPLGSVDERSAVGEGFLAHLCVDWERAASKAEGLGLRVVLLRTALVVGRDGGFLAPQLPIFRLGLGAVLGSGNQSVPWIHIQDYLEALVLSLEDDRITGPLNLVSPRGTTNREWTRALAHAVGRPAHLRVPEFALRWALGEASRAVLGGAHVIPRRLKQVGFEWRFPDLDTALHDVTSDAAVQVSELSDRAEGTGGSPPTDGYLARRRPMYALETRVEVDAPIERVFDFFARPENLGALTPAGMSWDVQRAPGHIEEGSELEYSIRVGPVPMRWKARIAEWHPDEGFVDAQIGGPYKSWWHEHRFQRSADDRTVVTDRVLYAPPWGMVGRVAHRAFVRRQLEDIFGFRDAAIRLRFRSTDAPRQQASP